MWRWLTLLDEEATPDPQAVWLRHLVKSAVHSLILELEQAQRAATRPGGQTLPARPPWWRRLWARLMELWRTAA